MRRIKWRKKLSDGMEVVIATMEAMNSANLPVYISRNSIIENCSAPRFVFDIPLEEVQLQSHRDKYHKTVRKGMPFVPTRERLGNRLSSLTAIIHKESGISLVWR